jgi:hypothetical protein
MDLTLAERLALAMALPTEGNFLTLRTASGLRDKLLPTDAEVEAWSVVADGDSVKWEATDTNADVEITNAETAAVIDLLRKLDTDKALTANHLTLYEKFVEG